MILKIDNGDKRLFRILCMLVIVLFVKSSFAPVLADAGDSYYNVSQTFTKSNYGVTYSVLSQGNPANTFSPNLTEIDFDASNANNPLYTQQYNLPFTIATGNISGSKSVSYGAGGGVYWFRGSMTYIKNNSGGVDVKLIFTTFNQSALNGLSGGQAAYCLDANDNVAVFPYSECTLKDLATSSMANANAVSDNPYQAKFKFWSPSLAQTFTAWNGVGNGVTRMNYRLYWNQVITSSQNINSSGYTVTVTKTGSSRIVIRDSSGATLYSGALDGSSFSNIVFSTNTVFLDIYDQNNNFYQTLILTTPSINIIPNPTVSISTDKTSYVLNQTINYTIGWNNYDPADTYYLELLSPSPSTMSNPIISQVTNSNSSGSYVIPNFVTPAFPYTLSVFSLNRGFLSSASNVFQITAPFVLPTPIPTVPQPTPPPPSTTVSLSTDKTTYSAIDSINYTLSWNNYNTADIYSLYISSTTGYLINLGAVTLGTGTGTIQLSQIPLQGRTGTYNLQVYSANNVGFLSYSSPNFNIISTSINISTANLSWSKSQYIYPIPDQTFAINYNISNFISSNIYIMQILSPSGKIDSYFLYTSNGMVTFAPRWIEYGTWSAQILMNYNPITTGVTTLLTSTAPPPTPTPAPTPPPPNQTNYQISWDKTSYNVGDTANVKITIPAGQTAFYNNEIEYYGNNPSAQSRLLSASLYSPYNLTIVYIVRTDQAFFNKANLATLSKTGTLDANDVIYASASAILIPFSNITKNNVSVSWGGGLSKGILYYTNPTNNFSTLTITRPDTSIYYSSSTISNNTGQIDVTFDQSGNWLATITDNGNSNNTASSTMYVPPYVVSTNSNYLVWTTSDNIISPSQIIPKSDFYFQGDKYAIVWNLNRTFNYSIITGLELTVTDPNGNYVLVQDLNYSIRQGRISGSVAGNYQDKFRLNMQTGTYTARLKIKTLSGDVVSIGTSTSFWDSIGCQLATTQLLGIQLASITNYFGICGNLGTTLSNLSIAGTFYEDLIPSTTTELKPNKYFILAYTVNQYNEQIYSQTFNPSDNIFVRFSARDKTVKLYLFDINNSQIRFNCVGTGTITCTNPITGLKSGNYHIDMRESIEQPPLNTLNFTIVSVPIGINSWGTSDTTKSGYTGGIIDGQVSLLGLGVNNTSRFLFAMIWTVIFLVGGFAVTGRNANGGLYAAMLPIGFFTSLSFIQTGIEFFPRYFVIIIAFILVIKLGIVK